MDSRTWPNLSAIVALSSLVSCHSASRDDPGGPPTMAPEDQALQASLVYDGAPFPGGEDPLPIVLSIANRGDTPVSIDPRMLEATYLVLAGSSAVDSVRLPGSVKAEPTVLPPGFALVRRVDLRDMFSSLQQGPLVVTWVALSHDVPMIQLSIQ